MIATLYNRYEMLQTSWFCQGIRTVVNVTNSESLAQLFIMRKDVRNNECDFDVWLTYSFSEFR